MGRFKDLTGQRFESLVFIKKTKDRTSWGLVIWECKCDCGNVVYKIKKATSCGCKRYKNNKTNKTHGGSSSLEYTSWISLKGRCLNENRPNYLNYGARGITVCDRWLNSFENFLADMGKRPTKFHSIDRIDVNGNYEPSNCRWADHSEQARNQRRNKMVLNLMTGIYYNTIVEAAFSCNINKDTLRQNLNGRNPNKTDFILLK